MKEFWQEINRFLSRFLTPAVRAIFLANLIVFFIFALISPFSESFIRFYFLLANRPDKLLFGFQIWRPFTYLFLHAGFMHLLVNMLILWFFAPRLEYRWGTPKFIRFYFIVGVGAGLFHATVAFLFGNQASQYVIGASGAIYGVLLAYALYWPNDRVLLYFIIPVPVKYLVIFAAVITLFASMPGRAAQSNISHVTHLGGFLIAFLYVKYGGRIPQFPGRKGPRRVRVERVPPNNHPDFR